MSNWGEGILASNQLSTHIRRGHPNQGIYLRKSCSHSGSRPRERGSQSSSRQIDPGDRRPSVSFISCTPPSYRYSPRNLCGLSSYGTLSSSKSIRIPLLLTQVCKNWRNIALSTPQLWSTIHSPIPSLPEHVTSYDPLPADCPII